VRKKDNTVNHDHIDGNTN